MRYEISLELENEKIVQDYRRKCMSLLKTITNFNLNHSGKKLQSDNRGTIKNENKKQAILGLLLLL